MACSSAMAKCQTAQKMDTASLLQKLQEQHRDFGKVLASLSRA